MGDFPANLQPASEGEKKWLGMISLRVWFLSSCITSAPVSQRSQVLFLTEFFTVAEHT